MTLRERLRWLLRGPTKFELLRAISVMEARERAEASAALEAGYVEERARIPAGYWPGWRRVADGAYGRWVPS